MVRKQQEQSTYLYIHCRKEHVELSLTIMKGIDEPKDAKPTCTNLSRLRFYGSIFRPDKFKYKTATIYVVPHEGMEIGHFAENMGWVRTQDSNMLLYVFWPMELFRPLNVLASSGRISTISVSISPLQRGLATVRALNFDTQLRAEHEEELDYWFMAKPRKKKEQ